MSARTAAGAHVAAISLSRALGTLDLVTAIRDLEAAGAEKSSRRRPNASARLQTAQQHGELAVILRPVHVGRFPVNRADASAKLLPYRPAAGDPHRRVPR